jgi:cold shock protein
MKVQFFRSAVFGCIINKIATDIQGGNIMSKLTGKTKWFDPKKGWGFVTSDDGQDYFLHYAQLQVEGFKTTNQGDVVEFEVTQGEKGPMAANVVIVTPAPKSAPKAE